jgi:hypothetical protein
MAASHIVQSCCSIFKGFWKRHQLNVGLMVGAVMSAKRVGVACLGRELPGATAPKHSIKRVDRFLSNQRFDHFEAQKALLRQVVGPRERVLIAIDWTKIREWPVLVAAVVHKGRAIPVLWSVLDPRKAYKSMNAFENGFFTLLADFLPEGTKATVLLDRGFKRVELMPHLRRLGLDFVIRTGGNVHVRHARYSGRMDGLLHQPGTACDFVGAILRPSRPVETRIVGVHQPQAKEPWLLATSLPDPAAHIAKLYSRRFRIEESFRDEKDVRFGLHLRLQRVTRADRLERLLLIAAVAHYIAMLYGALARSRKLDRTFRANTVTTEPTHSDFTLGLYYVHRLKQSLAYLRRLFLADAIAEFGG